MAPCRRSSSRSPFPVAFDSAAEVEIDHGQPDRRLLRYARLRLEVLVLDGHLAQNHRAEVRNRDHVSIGVAGIVASRPIDQ